MNKKLLFCYLIFASVADAASQEKVRLYTKEERALYKIPEEHNWRWVATVEQIEAERKAAIIEAIERFRAQYFEYWESLVLYAAGKPVLLKHQANWRGMERYFPFCFPLYKDEKLVIAAVAEGKIQVASVALPKRGVFDQFVTYLEERKQKEFDKKSSNESFSSVETQPSRFSCLFCSRGGISSDDESN